MKKRILGLDLGVASIGWALVEELREEKSKIIKLGVRVNPLTADEKINFEKGRPLTTNADRTLKRGARRSLQRFKLRRENLITILIENGFITKEAPLTEIGKNTTYETLALRAKSAKEKIDLKDLAKILLSINKKRGYKSSRKAKNEEDGQAIDGMAVAKYMYDSNFTPGQYALELLTADKKYIPDFYRSDLQAEFDAIWNFQKQFYNTILTTDLYEALQGKNKTQTWAICKEPFGIVGAKLKGKRDELKKLRYLFRVDGLTEQLGLEHLAIALQEINNNLNQSSGYLGKISDRSKALYFNKETVGEYLYKQIKLNNHTSLKNQVFYRQDYLDEFEQIWETQAKFYPQLTNKLKEEIRDVVIFYQRKLKSQKGQLGFCQFESWEETYFDEIKKKENTRTVGRKVVAKSSPLFQEFKIWQNLNNLQFINQQVADVNYVLEEEDRMLLFEALNLRGNLKENQVLKMLGLKTKEWKTNFPDGLEGNNTNKALYNVYEKIAEATGYGEDWAKKSAKNIKEEVTAVFKELGITTELLNFNANAEGQDFDKQPAYQLWHLLYATEDDEKISKKDSITYGNSSVSLKKKLIEKFGFNVEHAKMLVNVTLPQDYSNLSSKAIRKLIPYLEAGHPFAKKDAAGNGIGACDLAGYNHSKSETKEQKEQKEQKVYETKLKLLKKNSLRNPVVEKILNQMVNVVNQVIDEYGKIDEVRIELARELKKNAKEREVMTKSIGDATRRNEGIRKIITKEFNIPNPTKNDVIRYRLWQELAANGYKEVFTNKKISHANLFSKDIEIEHIIPKALLFDDSFSNKTLAFSKINKQKSNRTAFDFINNDFNANLENYKARVESLYNNDKGAFSKAKRNKLLLAQKDLPDGFIERDLRNSQFIAKKAKELLTKVCKDVVATSGNITDKLRQDWDLINVMKELNLPKYEALGLIEVQERLDKGTGKRKEVKVIKDWTKRNDHRHHAMDALTVAFTTHNHIQYLNYLNARKNEAHTKYGVINNIEKKIRKGSKFIAPMPNFRTEAKKHIESVLVSVKNKNKVVTKNINVYNKKKNIYKKEQLTPRGQLHKETVYGSSKRLMSKATKLSKRFTLKDAQLIANPIHKELVLQHLQKYKNNGVLAFDAKILKKTPLLYKNEALKEVLCFEEIFTIRKAITPDLKIDKVVDVKIQAILRARLLACNNKPKEAFSNLEENPIWLNKAKGIAIKRVAITGVSNATPLHYKKDNLGNEILNTNGNKQPVDFVSTGNNHHIAIYKDEKGKLQDSMVSFYEAVVRKNQGLPIIDKELNKNIGWQFLFTMKQNEMFVFPSDEFNPSEINLLDVKKTSVISKHLFRVQKISKVSAGNSFVRDFVFRNHLETTVKEEKSLRGKTYIQLKSLEGLREIIKVRINHIGKIVHVGEY